MINNHILDLTVASWKTNGDADREQKANCPKPTRPRKGEKFINFLTITLPGRELFEIEVPLDQSRSP